MTQATSVRFDEKTESALAEYVAIHKISKSEFIKKAVAEALEDYEAIREADLAYKDWQEGGRKTHSHDEMMERYG